MKSLKAIIIDDEEAARITLSKLLEWNAPDVNIVALCSNVDDAIHCIHKHQPDLIFLDIEMPVKNGFDLLQEIGTINFEVVFVTAYDQFAVEAFKRHALAYLLKPVDEDELKIVIDRAKKHITSPLNEETLSKLFESLQIQQPTFNKIAIPTIEGLELIKVDQIVRCSSDGNYTYIHLSVADPILVSKTLKQIEEQLQQYNQFVRVHHSHLVNLFFVKRYQKGKGGSLVMEDNSIVPVSRSRKDQLLSQF
jgi:two-component system LytT family response regulator